MPSLGINTTLSLFQELGMYSRAEVVRKMSLLQQNRKDTVHPCAFIGFE